MPTIIHERGFKVKIYFNDHPPAHVHVLKAGKRAKVYLNPVSLWESDMKPNETKQAVEIVEENHDTLLAEWIIIHGTEDENGDTTE